jgi:hypothetical protein
MNHIITALTCENSIKDLPRNDNRGNPLVLNNLPNEQSAKHSLFSITAISQHLQILGYPEKSINSMNRCGEVTCQIIKVCPECGPELKDLKHRCNLRTCPECSKIRKRRIRRKYLPLLNGCKPTQKDFLYFLTISPKNYENLEFGMEHIRKSFSKFLRLNYIKERIRGGVYVIEAKNSEDGTWNIHIHSIIYGRRLDNKIGGHCKDCHRSNVIKFDYINKKYYCSKCNSENLNFSNSNKDSKLVSLWKQSSGREVNMHISKQDSVGFTLNYMLKYISANKDDFATPQNMARYIVATRKRKLINTFGMFFKQKIIKEPTKCFVCDSEVEFIFDLQVVSIMKQSSVPPDRPQQVLFGVEL